VSAELLKLRRPRSAWIPLAAALAIAVVAVIANTSMTGHDGNMPLSPAVLPELLRAGIPLDVRPSSLAVHVQNARICASHALIAPEPMSVQNGGYLRSLAPG
jgi:hypothetical protein